MREGAPSAARLAEELAAARQMETDTRAELARLQTLRTTLLDADDAVQVKNRNAINAARDNLEDIGLYVAELGKRHAAAEKAEHEQAKNEMHAAALKQSEAAAKVLAREYPAAARRMLEILRTVAEAQLAIDNAMAAGCPGFEGPESLARSVNGEVPDAALCTQINLPGLKRFEPPYFEMVRPFYDPQSGATSGDADVMLMNIKAALDADRGEQEASDDLEPEPAPAGRSPRTSRRAAA